MVPPPMNFSIFCQRQGGQTATGGDDIKVIFDKDTKNVVVIDWLGVSWSDCYLQYKANTYFGSDFGKTPERGKGIPCF